MDGASATIWISKAIPMTGRHATKQPVDGGQRPKRRDELNGTRPDRSNQIFAAQHAGQTGRRLQLKATLIDSRAPVVARPVSCAREVEALSVCVRHRADRCQ
jgi:hypothetical protein